MNWIRRPAWGVSLLAAVIGCAGDEEAAPPVNPLPPVNTPAPRPNLSPAAKPEPAQDQPKPSASQKPEEPKKDELPKVEGPKTEATKSTAAPVKLTTDELAAIKELPAAEQDQAIKQAVCPVSGEHLGEMGKPVKVSAEGRTFFLCCDDCQEKVKKDPKAVIAKLDKK
jgi:YHS domain-containing protein